jgi:tetratricopeptide (TPR) repeat protein
MAMGERARTRHEIRVLESTLNLVRSAAAALSDGGGIETRARVRLLETQLLVMKADYRGAAEAAAEAAALAEQAGLLPLVAKARLTQAWIVNWSGEGPTEDFVSIVERAVEACRRAGDLPSEIEARHIGSNVQFAIGRLDEFVEINERLVEQARAIGDAAHEAAITVRLVAVEHMQGNVSLAARHAAEAEALATRHGFRNVTLRLAFDRGSMRMFAGDLAEAEEMFRRYGIDAREAGAVQHNLSALRYLGYTLAYARKYADAAGVLDEALRLSEATGERWNRSELLALRARAALEVGDRKSADGFIERAVSSLRDLDITGISEVRDHLGVIRAAQGRDAEAEEALRRSLEVVAGTGYNTVKINAALDLAMFLAERGRLDEASLLADEYSRLAEQRGWKVWRLQTSEIRRLITSGQTA